MDIRKTENENGAAFTDRQAARIDQLEALNAELVDAIKRLLRNRIPHDNAIKYAKSVVAKVQVVS